MRKKYRWEEWFQQDRTVLVRGADYDCSQSTMAGMVRNAASKAGVRVTVVDTGDSLVVEVRGAVQHTDKTAVPG